MYNRTEHKPQVTIGQKPFGVLKPRDNGRINSTPYFVTIGQKPFGVLKQIFRLWRYFFFKTNASLSGKNPSGY